MSRDLPAGLLVRVTVELALPASATEDEVDEWLRYNFHDSCEISTKNPLSDHEPEAFRSGSLDWDDLGVIGRREEYGHTPTENGTQYKVRYIREPVAARKEMAGG